MTIWSISDFRLEAHYVGRRDPDTLTVKCRSLSLLPAEYGPDDVAADGAIMKSLIARPSLLAKGVDGNKLGTIAWTRLLFTDPKTGAQKEFDIRVMDTPETDTARFEILNEM